MNADATARRLPLPLLAAAIALLLLVVFGQFPTQHRWGPDLADAAHGPAFAVLTLLLVPLLRPLGRGRIGTILLAAGIATTLGGVVELVQWALGRDSSLTDLLHDALGAAAAVGAMLAWRPVGASADSGRALRVLGLVTTLVTTTALLVPPIELGSAYLQRQRSFPTLVDFHHWASTYFLATYGNVEVTRQALPAAVAAGAPALHARLAKRRGWTIALYEPSPDWRGWRTLAIDLVNPTEEALAMDAWVRDRRQGTRGDVGFRLPIRVPPRRHETVRLPLPPPQDAGGVDLSEVGSLFLVHAKANEAREFQVLRIWLE